jgi:hypothetical protein
VVGGGGVCAGGGGWKAGSEVAGRPDIAGTTGPEKAGTIGVDGGGPNGNVLGATAGGATFIPWAGDGRMAGGVGKVPVRRDRPPASLRL